MEVENTELASKNEILRLELWQVINKKQITDQAVKLVEEERVSFGGESPETGAG
jgi:hypothetical protein